MNQESLNLPRPPELNSIGDPRPADLAAAEATLRLLARLEPPIGVADRVHYRLEQAEQAQEARVAEQHRGFWALWMPARRLQYAGAAILALAVGVSTWGVHHAHHDASQGSGSQPVNPTIPTVSASGFGTAGAERNPDSLTPIKVPPVHKKKPSASRVKAGYKTSGPGATAASGQSAQSGQLGQLTAGQEKSSEPKQ